MKKYFLISFLILSGCAGQMVFNKPHTTKQQFYADQSQCNMQARITTGGDGGLNGLAEFMIQKQMCMAGKGYTCRYDQSGQPCEVTN